MKEQTLERHKDEQKNREQTKDFIKRAHSIKKRTPSGKLKFMKKFFGSRTYHVIMRNKNGYKEEYYIKCDPTAVYFTMKSGAYIIMESACVWNDTLKCMDIEYHEGFSIPLSMQITEKEILDPKTRDRIESLNMRTSIYPDVAKEAIEAKNIKAGLQAGTLADKYKMLIVGMWLTFGICAAHLLFFMNQNGMIPGVK